MGRAGTQEVKPQAEPPKLSNLCAAARRNQPKPSENATAHAAPMKSARYKRAALALGLLILLGSCASTATRRTSWTVEAPPAVTAWVLAGALRAEFPGADPEPWHSGEPVIRLGKDRFELDYRGRESQVFRCSTNGRLMPPQLCLENDNARFGRPVFRPTTSPSVAPSESGWVTLQIIPAKHSTASHPGSDVELELSDSRSNARIESHVERSLALLETVYRTAALAEEKAWPELSKAVTQALSAKSTSCCAHHRILIAPVHIQRARLYRAQGRLQEARIALNRALDFAPDAKHLRSVVAQIDKRLAWPRAARDHWIRLSHDVEFGPMAYAIAGRIRTDLARAARNTEGHNNLDRSLDRLRAGDTHGALAWARRAVSLGEDPSRSLDVAIQIHRHRGDHATALGLGLAQLADNGAETKTILGIADSCIALGQPKVALRMLTRYWSQMQVDAPSASRRAFARAESRIPSDLVLRIVASEHAEQLTRELLARQTGKRNSPAGLAVLRMAPSLRQRSEEQFSQPHFEAHARPDYESAPGVSPPR